MDNITKDVAITSGGIGSGSTKGGMQGFGNTPSTASGDNILSSLKDLADKVLEAPSQQQQASLSRSTMSTGAYDPVTDPPIERSTDALTSVENKPNPAISVRPKVKGKQSSPNFFI